MRTLAPNRTIVIAEVVRIPGLFVESVAADHLSVTKDAPWLDAGIADIVAQWSARPSVDLERIPEIHSYRELSRRFSTSFGAVVPAVENLAARTVTRGIFPRINSLVDAANVASLRHMIPIGIFDAHSIAGDLTLDIARGTEEIVPLGKSKRETVPAGFPVLRDDEKVISIVGVRDSAQTMIVPTTTSALAFSWGIESISRDKVRATLKECIALCTAGGDRG